jgi:hypothetical protein
MERISRCRRCGDVIGAYEAMVVLSDGRATSTLRARAEEDAIGAGECYHAECFAQTHDIPVER